MGMASQSCCEPTLGIFGSNWIWILILILICCGGFGRGCCDGGSVLGTNLFGGNSWILILILLFCFCGNRIF